MSVPIETAIIGDEMAAEGTAPEIAMAAEGAAPKVLNIEVLTEVPKSLRSPRSRPTLTKEGPKTKKYKQKMPHPIRASPKKHPQKENPPMQEKLKVVDMEPEEDVEEIHMGEEDIDMGAEDVDIEGS